MTLENITGNLKDAYKQCVPGTMQHVDQLMNEKRTNPGLRNQYFYTADGNIYSLDNGVPTLRITREAVNPVLNHLEDKVNSSYDQLVKPGDYQVLPTDFDTLKAAADTITIDLTKLNLQGDEKEWRYFSISTAKYNTHNPEQRKLAERVYGQGTDFTENMKMLTDAGISETRVYVLNPKYVTEHAKEGPIGRASWLGIFSSNSYFIAGVRSINGSYRVRGVRREVVVPAGDALKNEQVPSAPQKINSPSIEDILQYTSPFVTDVKREQFEAGLRKLYHS